MDSIQDPDTLLRVHYPLGGRLHLVHWWTSYDRGHVVLAPSARAAVTTCRLLAGEHPSAEVKAYYEIDVVSPPPSFHAALAADVMAEKVMAFRIEVVSEMSDVLRAGHALPPLFAKCERYEPEDSDEAQDEWSRERHYDCKHCHDGLILSMTDEELYARYRPAWISAFPQRYPAPGPEQRQIKGYFCRAPAASEGEELWVAREEFGDHAAGVALYALDDQDYSFASAYRGARALFFFRNLRELDPGMMQAIFSVAFAKLEKEQEEVEQERRARAVREDLSHIEAALSVFKGA